MERLALVAASNSYALARTGDWDGVAVDVAHIYIGNVAPVPLDLRGLDVVVGPDDGAAGEKCGHGQLSRGGRGQDTTPGVARDTGPAV